MPRYNFDLSEYQQPSSTDYQLSWDGYADLSPVFFHNRVAYSPEEKALYLSVDGTYEFEAMFELYDRLDCPIPEGYSCTPDADEVDRRRDDLRKIRDKFGTAFAVREPIPLYPYSSSERKINAFSGTEIRVPLGEGLLNFCYADFGAAFARCDSAYQELAQKDTPPRKIHRVEEGVLQLYELYAEIFPALREVFYSSVYTASFPPQFTRCTEKALAYYRKYLTHLQSEFLELLAFCLDKDLRPEVLGRLYPSERFDLWCRIRGVSPSHTRQETFLLGHYRPRGTAMPFGADIDLIDIDQEIVLSPEQKAFAKEYGISESELQIRYKFPCFIHISYACDNLRDMLYLEFTKILETGVEFQKCRRCGKYFIVKGNYHGAYCDRIAKDESRTCQQLAAQEAYLNKLKNNDGQNALNVYQKFYKRYFARTKAGSLSEDRFKRWQYEAVQKRGACLDGLLTLQEFTDWLEASMPNRAKEKRT